MENSDFFRQFDISSSIAIESFYVIDVIANRFCNVSNDLFLCGHAVEEASVCGTDFYKEIVSPDDLLLWKKIYRAILCYLRGCGEKRNKIDYFSCTFHLQRKFSFLPQHPLSQMVCHKIEPVWENGGLHYLNCTMNSSATKNVGNLRMYYKDGSSYEEYNTITRQWKWKTIEPLTERESVILMLAQQGKCSGEIASCLCKGLNTIRNQIKSLFSKLNVHSMQEAIEFADYHPVIFTKMDKQSKPIAAPYKKIRISLTDNKKQRIQQHLNNGESNRQIAKLERVAEGAIRYWIKKGILKTTKKSKS